MNKAKKIKHNWQKNKRISVDIEKGENVALPKKVPLFIKFVDKKYLSDFLKKGTLHFGTLEEYRNMAHPGIYKQVDSIIGDANEDVFHREYSEGTRIECSNTSGKLSKTTLSEKERVTYRSVMHPNAAVFCFTAVPRDALYSTDGVNYKIQPSFWKIITKEFSMEDKVPVILIDIGYIWEMVRLNSYGIDYGRGPVVYSGSQKSALEILSKTFKNEVDMKNLVPFSKDIRYRAQYEYRFFLGNKNVLDECHNLNIGSLKGKVEVIDDLNKITINAVLQSRIVTFTEIYGGLKFHSFKHLALIEFNNKCKNNYYKVNV